MRKLFVLLLLVLSVCAYTPAQAKIHFGVKGGLNMTKLSFSDIGWGALSSEHKQGFFIGPMAELSTVTGVGFDASLLYNQVGDDEYKQAGVDIPLNLKYTHALGNMLGVYVAVGPDFFFNFKKNASTSTLSTEGKSAMVGVNIGGGVRIMSHLQIGLNYNAQLGHSGEVTLKEAANPANYKFNTWQISAAYIF